MDKSDLDFYLQEELQMALSKHMRQVNQELFYILLDKFDYDEYVGFASTKLICMLNNPYVFIDDEIHVLFPKEEDPVFEEFMKKYLFPPLQDYDPNEHQVICTLVDYLHHKIIPIWEASRLIYDYLPCDFALSPDYKCFALDIDSFQILQDEMSKTFYQLIPQRYLGLVISSFIELEINYPNPDPDNHL